MGLLASNGSDTADVQCILKVEAINIRYWPSPDLRLAAAGAKDDFQCTYSLPV